MSDFEERKVFIQGHTQNGIGAAIYTHFDIEEIRKELNKLKV